MLAKRLLAATALLTSAIAHGQSPIPPPASQSAYDPVAPLTATTGVQEIHVDGLCRILPPQTIGAGKKAKPKPQRDPVICHLEGILSSNHVEETIVAGIANRSMVTVDEQEYVLQNVATEPIVFVVEHAVPAGWRIDSDPPPVDTLGPIAIFHAHAQPGEIVPLHVGMRHAHAMKPKQVSLPPLGP
jgi:hypothetical protein